MKLVDRVTVYAEDVSGPEGPVSLPSGEWLITEMKRGVITRLSQSGRKRATVARTGRPNGLCVESAGRIWVAESRTRELICMDSAGRRLAATGGPPDSPFLWPNDLVFGPDGAIYLTDSGVFLADFDALSPPSAAYTLPFNGRLWRVDPDSMVATILDDGLRFANGIGFAPGGGTIYVTETLSGNIFAYRIDTAGRVHDRSVLCRVTEQEPASYGVVAGPDGMAVSESGRLYVAVLTEGIIAIVEPDGRVTERVALPGTFPTNIAFSAVDPHFALVTEISGSQLLAIHTKDSGLAAFGTTTPN